MCVNLWIWFRLICDYYIVYIVNVFLNGFNYLFMVIVLSNIEKYEVIILSFVVSVLN